jgi:hypothetical protein
VHRFVRSPARFLARLLLAALAALGCAPEPVAWEVAASHPGSVADGARLALADTAGRIHVDTVRLPPPGDSAGRCPGSLRVARAGGAERAFAAWWSVRPDSSAELRVARTADRGLTWDPPMVAERRDRAVTGCTRPAPDIYVDSATGYVHVAYFIVAPEAPGVFFSHATSAQAMAAQQMPGHDMASHAAGDDLVWHAPVTVVYGERPSRASVAAHGDTVVVAYEDPNSRRTPRIGLVMSHTQGHIFETRLPQVSGAVGATRPLVAVRGRTVAVGWQEAGRPGEVVVRVGRLR